MKKTFKITMKKIIAITFILLIGVIILNGCSNVSKKELKSTPNTLNTEQTEEQSEDEKIINCIIKNRELPTCFQISTKTYSTWKECKQFQTAFDKLKCLFNAEDAFEDDSEELNKFGLAAMNEFERKYPLKYLAARRICDYKDYNHLEEELKPIYEECCKEFSQHDNINKLENCLSEKIYEGGLY